MSKDMSEDVVWKRLISVCTNYFDNIEVRDKTAGWIKPNGIRILFATPLYAHVWKYACSLRMKMFLPTVYAFRLRKRQ